MTWSIAVSGEDDSRVAAVVGLPHASGPYDVSIAGRLGGTGGHVAAYAVPGFGGVITVVPVELTSAEVVEDQRGTSLDKGVDVAAPGSGRSPGVAHARWGSDLATGDGLPYLRHHP